MAGLDPFGDDGDDDDHDGGDGGDGGACLDGGGGGGGPSRGRHKMSAEEALGDLLGDYGEIDMMKSEAM